MPIRTAAELTENMSARDPVKKRAREGGGKKRKNPAESVR